MATPNQRNRFTWPSSEEALARVTKRYPGLTRGLEPYDPDAFRQEMRDKLSEQIHGTPRVQHSRGFIRLNNDRNDHSIDLDVVGALQQAWQASVHGLGMAIELGRAPSKVSDNVIERTTLELVAAPRIGSIILDIKAKADPMPEAYPDGQCCLDDQPTPLVDLAVTRLHTILNKGSQELCDDFTTEIKEVGLQLSQPLQTIAEVLDEQALTLSSKWLQPGTKPIEASISNRGAKWIRKTLDGVELEPAEVHLVGKLHTISKAGRWKVQLERNENDAIPRGGILDMTLDPNLDIARADFHIDQIVRLDVIITSRQRPDGEYRSHYTIKRISPQ